MTGLIIAAVVLMGDPRYLPNKSFNAGTSKTKGLFPRGNDALLDSFAARIQSYCDTGDPFCASVGLATVTTPAVVLALAASVNCSSG